MKRLLARVCMVLLLVSTFLAIHLSLELKKLNACKENLRQVAANLEVHRAEHDKYPDRLERDTPSCPVGPVPSYEKEGDFYRLSCPGTNHRAAGVETDYPQATPDGLQIEPRPWVQSLLPWLRFLGGNS